MDLPDDPDAVLAELAALGLRAARVVVRIMEVEQQMVDLAASWLPAPGPFPQTPEVVYATGNYIDLAEDRTKTASPHVKSLAQALDRITRSVRRSVALRKRIQAGWPRQVDDRPAMVRRQVARAVGQAIQRERHGDAAERLFDELNERLDDPEIQDELLTLPVEQIVRRICRDLGLAAPALASCPGDPPPAQNTS